MLLSFVQKLHLANNENVAWQTSDDFCRDIDKRARGTCNILEMDCNSSAQQSDESEQCSTITSSVLSLL